MDVTDPKPSNWNAPNVITGVRILATPFFVWMLLADDGRMGPLRWAAAVFFVLAIATDAWDGHLARSR
ncbi:MAG: CDP-alcohol phosphatidyltransferase family protein, partial [Actinobacteria bacterium]|nr:CDP-alcohol phosphatidyltransferase family protein [Actinomycetota bacterium]